MAMAMERSIFGGADDRNADFAAADHKAGP